MASIIQKLIAACKNLQCVWKISLSNLFSDSGKKRIKMKQGKMEEPRKYLKINSQTSYQLFLKVLNWFLV